MSIGSPSFVEHKIPRHARIAIAAARFNEEIVDELLAGCLSRLAELGLAEKRVRVVRVPGAFELPVAAQILCGSEEYAAVICLGCVIRGETPHFDLVAGQCAAGIQRVALEQRIPVIFGVLATDTLEQAQARTGGSHGHVGRQAAEAAVEMAAAMMEIIQDDDDDDDDD